MAIIEGLFENDTQTNIIPDLFPKVEPTQKIEQKKTSPFFKAIGYYFKEAQPAFKFAVQQPQTLLGKPALDPKTGQPITSQELERTTNLPWADVYRESNLPFSKSTTMAKQMLPQVAGELLEFGTKPSTYITAGVVPWLAKKAAIIPITRRFLARQMPTLSKTLLAKNPIQPQYKDTPFGKVDITQPYKPAPEITLKKIKEFFVMNKDYTLDRAKQAVNLIDETRSNFGIKVSKAIDKFKDVMVDEKELYKDMPNLPKNVASALTDPMYEIEILGDGSVKSNIGNLHKVQEALGDFMTTKDWFEASRTNKEIISRVYGKIAESIKNAQPELKEPIEVYHKFMNLYREVNPTLRNTAGIILEKKLRNTLKVGAEREYQIAWQKMSKVIPQLEDIAKDIIRFNNRQILKTTIKKVAPWVIGGTLVGGGISRGLRHTESNY